MRWWHILLRGGRSLGEYLYCMQRGFLLVSLRRHQLGHVHRVPCRLLFFCCRRLHSGLVRALPSRHVVRQQCGQLAGCMHAVPDWNGLFTERRCIVADVQLVCRWQVRLCERRWRLQRLPAWKLLTQRRRRILEFVYRLRGRALLQRLWRIGGIHLRCVCARLLLHHCGCHYSSQLSAVWSWLLLSRERSQLPVHLHSLPRGHLLGQQRRGLAGQLHKLSRRNGLCTVWGRGIVRVCAVQRRSIRLCRQRRFELHQLRGGHILHRSGRFLG
jgi:hypothetical protein